MHEDDGDHDDLFIAAAVAIIFKRRQTDAF